MRHFFDLLETPPDERARFSSVSLALASPEQIRAWSSGEVKVPATINFRTFEPENGGLFCAKIFGPLNDYECLCGKYKRTKIRRKLTCEKCGVEVTTSRVRRERMGHIELASPIANILYFKSLPSHIGLALNMTMRDIERVLDFEAYVVIDPRRAPLEPGQMLTIEEFQRYELKCRSDFVAGIGGEGLRDYLKSLDLDSEAELLREEMSTTSSTTRHNKAFKRLKLVENFRQTGLRPEWMILEALPVLPPDLRPFVQLDDGRFITSDLNDLYRRVINRNNRLRRLMELNAPSVIVNNEKRMLQEAVDSLLDNGRRGKPVLGSNRRPLKSLVDVVEDEIGRFRQTLLGKRVDFSGRSVIVPGPNLKLHQCGLPKQMALTLFRPFLFHRLITDSHAANIRQAKVMIEREEPAVWNVLEDVIHQHPVMLSRNPIPHRLGIKAFDPVLIEGKAIQLHPLVCAAFGATFSGDQMAVHIPLSLEAQAEARVLMLSSNNILDPASGAPIIAPTREIALGICHATRERAGRRGEGMAFADVAEIERALEAGAVELHSKIKLLVPDENSDDATGMILADTTPGRALLWRIFPGAFPFSPLNRVLEKQDIAGLMARVFDEYGLGATVRFADRLMRFGFETATKSGVSEFFVSAHEQCERAMNAALKTANSGRLTRRLVDVAHDLVIAEEDCGVVESGTSEPKGIRMRATLMDGKEVARLRDRILGRFTASEVRDPQKAEILYPAGTYIDSDIADDIADKGVSEVLVRSPATCAARRGVCEKCYGRDLARGAVARTGEAVGIIAAQSVGECVGIANGFLQAVKLLEAHELKEAAILAQVQSAGGLWDSEAVRDEDLHAILREHGVEKLTDHIVARMQEVCRPQGADINDKHIEVIVRQMLRNVKITKEGNSKFIEGDRIPLTEVTRKNNRLLAEGKTPAEYARILLGITKASLAMDSFLSAASVGSAIKVIAETSLMGRSDPLRGLKENVIVGRLIPAGTGFVHYREQGARRGD